MVGEQKFLDMEREYIMLKGNHDEACKMVTKYREDLKEEGDNVKHLDENIYKLEKEKKLLQAELNKSQDDLEKERESACELDLSRSAAVLAQTTAEGEWDQLKVQVEGFKAALAKAREEVIQEYRANLPNSFHIHPRGFLSSRNQPHLVRDISNKA